MRGEERVKHSSFVGDMVWFLRGRYVISTFYCIATCT